MTHFNTSKSCYASFDPGLAGSYNQPPLSTVTCIPPGFTLNNAKVIGKSADHWSVLLFTCNLVVYNKLLGLLRLGLLKDKG